MKNKGVFFSIDAVIALGMIILVLLLAFPLLKQTERETKLPKDIITTLTSLKVGEIPNTQIQSWISQGLIESEREIVEQIGLLSIKNLSLLVCNNLYSSIPMSPATLKETPNLSQLL